MKILTNTILVSLTRFKKFTKEDLATIEEPIIITVRGERKIVVFPYGFYLRLQRFINQRA